MKRAAVSLVESTSENIKRRKSFSKKQSEYYCSYNNQHEQLVLLYHAVLFTESMDTGIRQRIDSSSSGKKLAVSSSAQPNKKQKGNKKKS